MTARRPLPNMSSARKLCVLAAAGLFLNTAHAGNHTGSGLDAAMQRKQLNAGIRYVEPEYKGGMKFRTPDAIDGALVQELGKRLRLPVSITRAAPDAQAAALAAGKADVILAAVPDDAPIRKSATVIPLGYAVGPMAIMRSDTDIRSWPQLKGRKVCLSEGGLYAGTLAAQYGAIEMLKRAPADSLLAVRTGECDAAVHDNTMLEELIKLPEWKKFSARLPVVAPRASLAFIVPAGDDRSAATLTRIAKEWSASRYPDHLVAKAVRHIAFEVYLDQDAPDCH
ncbi:type 2 periplasmic-binding domain-containing protein [Noviherbaspirillum aerium]|uniref:transporter substrate-binding domain-containing protein n=1 Tax=Noviherbaspirillum aerium TaxID=2588497 RepID=UPI00124EA1F5|nr:transporter substrate-binding domain-containing protein [Noviherbaspirillum aerium]